MSDFPRRRHAGGTASRAFLTGFAMVLALAAVLWWLLGRTAPSAGNDPQVPAAAASQSTPSAPWKPNASGGSASGANVEAPADSSNTSPATGSDAPPTPELDSWLESNWNKDDNELVDGLLEFCAVKERGLDEKRASLGHALNLLPDTQYQKLLPLLGDPNTPQPLLEEVIADIHNRGEEAALSASLVLMRSPLPTIAQEAKKIVAFLLDMDEANDAESLRLQGETRLIEIDEAKAAPGEP